MIVTVKPGVIHGSGTCFTLAGTNITPGTCSLFTLLHYGPLARYVKLRAVNALWMPGTFSPPPTSKETANARAVIHVGIANPRWRGKRLWYSRRMRNPQFYVSAKRAMHGVVGLSLGIQISYFRKSSVFVLFFPNKRHIRHINISLISQNSDDVDALYDVLWFVL